MCEQEYVGCPECERAADSGDLYQIAYQRETIHYFLDDDGCISHDREPRYQEDLDSDDDGYGCECGWRGQSLAHDLSREDCECAECVPPEFDEVDDEDADEDAFVRLHTFPTDISDLPLELQILAKDRCAWVALMPRWRSAELYAEWSNLISVDYEPRSVCESEARELMPTYPSFDDREVCTA